MIILNRLTLGHRALLLNRRQAGLTLIELIVTLVILSVLASAALPYAEIAFRRDKELELRRALREIRTAIDYFNADWQAGKFPLTGDAASKDGFPKTLTVLVDGVDLAGVIEKRRFYLRRIPGNPFADATLEKEEQWQLRSYRDKKDAAFWGSEDVYDVRVRTEKIAINKTYYKDW